MLLVPADLNVERTTFDLDVFLQILQAMDGYPTLPSAYQGEDDDDEPNLVEPWDLPGMPSVSLDSWRYHVGFAIDRGFVQCWTPSQQTRTRHNVRQSGSLMGTVMGETSSTRYSRDPNVSTDLQPARLTYAGKEFIDNLSNQSVRDKAAAALKQYGLPVAMQVVIEAAKQWVGSEASSPTLTAANQPSA